MVVKKIIILILSIFVILVSFIFFVHYKNVKNFNTLINKTDKAYLDNDFENVKNNILNIVNTKSNFNSRQYKMVLKRAYSIKDFDLLEKISYLAFKKYKKDPFIFNIYLFSLIKNQDYTTIKNLVDSDLTQGNQNLITEAIIRSGIKNDKNSLLYDAINEREPETYHKIFRMTNNTAFKIDELLLYLKLGEFFKAKNIADEIMDQTSLISKLKFYTYYDAEEYDSAFKILHLSDIGIDPVSFNLLNIDLLLKTDCYDEALKELDSFIKLYPEGNWKSYYNYLLLNFNRKNYNVKSTLEEALSHYPLNIKLLLLKLEYNKQFNYTDESLAIINSYLERNDTKFIFPILKEELIGISNPETFINNIRTILNDSPENLHLYPYFLWNLVEYKRSTYLSNYILTLDRFRNKDWYYFFNALNYEMKGQDNSAIEELEKAFEILPRWEFLYNIAVIQRSMLDFNKSIDYFIRAENSLSTTPENFNLKSLIRTELAFTLFSINEYQKSYNELLNALDMDKNNLKAKLLLKKVNFIINN